jgi:hypothetical protein
MEKVVFLKKLSILVVILLAALILVVYKNINSSLNPHIALRKTIDLPIKGTWTASRYLVIGDSDVSQDEISKSINKKISFNGNEVKYYNLICKDPEFKVKVVDSEKYFKKIFKVEPDLLGINEKQVKVITVSSHNNFFDDFIQINNDVIMKFSDGLALFFTRDGSSNNKTVLNNIRGKDFRVEVPKNQRDITSKSGLLLGLKSKNLYTGGYDYRTLWISSSYNQIHHIEQRKNIIVPRKSGFWEIGVNKKYDENDERDIIWGSPLIKDNSKSNKSNVVVRDIENTSSEIMFVGNEYISLDNSEVKNRYFSVLPIDNLDGNKVDFSKAFDKRSGEMLRLSAEVYIKRIGKSGRNITLNNIGTNWGVARRSGRWILRGRISCGDFDILYAEPNKEIATYDDLYPSFDVVKNKIPDVLDAYTSPNRDFIVILTKNDIKVFSLNDRGIGKLQTVFKLKNGETSVMAQWAVGNYINAWDKLFENKN